MEIHIFGYKFDLVILVLIAIVYFILAGHTLCGCCNHGLIETFTKLTDMSGNEAARHHVLANHASKKEGFRGANINDGQSSLYDLTNNDPVDTSSWSAQNMTVSPDKPNSAGVQSILSRAPQPIPLPKGEMLLFATTPFKPECCPNAYSTSQGCACMTGQQYNYLVQRGMNNVPYSEY